MGLACECACAAEAELARRLMWHLSCFADRQMDRPLIVYEPPALRELGDAKELMAGLPDNSAVLDLEDN